MNNSKKLIFSIILIFSLLAVGVSAFLITEALKEEGAYAIISQNGKTVATYSLSDNGEYEINGGTNVIVIEDGKAYMKHADCPDKLCINQGVISHTGERIVCLPNRIMVEIIGGEDEIIIN